MMNELLCPKCNAQSPEGAFYCQSCSQPLLCKSCKALLLPNARACIQCGLLIPERSNDELFHLEASMTLPGYSRFKIHKTSENLDLDFLVANGEIEHIKDFFPPVAGTRPPGHFKASPDHQAQQTNLVEVTSEEPSPQPQLSVAMNILPSPEQLEEQRVWQIFKQRDGRLIQDISDLKAAHQKDYVVRLAYLYLRAKELKGEVTVPRKEVFKILGDAGVMDQNAYRYIPGSGLRLEDDETLYLTSEARKQSQQYIAEIFNDEVPKGWQPGQSTHPTNGRTKKSTKRNNDQHAKSDTLVAEWIALEKTRELNQEFPQSITGTFSVEDKALFGLYCLDKAGVTAEIQPVPLSRYLYGAFQLNIRSDGIRFKRSLERIPPHVVRSKDSAAYRITQSGSIYMEQVLRQVNHK